MASHISHLKDRIGRRDYTVGIIGLGYVGLPAVLRFWEVGFRVLGFDIDPHKVKRLNAGESYIRHLPSDRIASLSHSGRFEATGDFARLGEADALLVCVPTPLTRHRNPDLQYVIQTADAIARTLRPGQLICLESTTYPGTTEELLLPRFEAKGLTVGEDFFLVFSPEREDPGNARFGLAVIPKVLGGVSDACGELGEALYATIVSRVIRVASPKVAEMTKLLENIYRAINIALVNELKMLSDRMGINIWEAIDAAATKPFGFQPFYPGPGLGGHCIPIDPFYLTWKAREYGMTTHFIELAGEINHAMPAWVVGKVIEALNTRGTSLNGAKVLVLGVAYKPDIDDQRESPALEILTLLRQQGAHVNYADPHVPRCYGHRHYPDLDLTALPLTAETIQAQNAVILVTNHAAFDLELIRRHAPLIVDTRNAFKGIPPDKVVKA
ncbi:UDP-N-acetyl-D-glucosamine dehydrogenase [Candidatus Methylomirabilis lanthanidiphila]|uniref:UDP-N-acetyl-D-glucosamine dehydrogenase n=1 Tax=Candidatus Methylomirabilis lanthanidiphila TaxID=2211376 RepID=A0A564ZGR3_9BACT|nr:nucleotide sugar dehydrogenase [Candidatus Methylomirabilis lanthanidiphila]VUZ84484.1 UDP-N-acetyl-D-glucosamine dehydrogenase [Candidatus Methylomirabilis lanthanidiphila]